MKIAITGATGYIGRFVLEALQNIGEHEIVAAVHTTPCVMKFNPNTTIVQFDLNEDSSDVYHRLGEPDLLVHLAWGELSNFMSTSHIEKELPRQFTFLKNMAVSGVKNIFVSGTCFEYGMLSGCLHEDMCCEPVIAYGLAKDLLRKQLNDLKKEYEFQLTWARIFYIDGEPPGRSTLLSSIKRSVASGEEFFNMSKGDQLRDFITIERAAALIVNMALKMLDIGVVNLCSGNPVSVKHLVEQRIKEMNWNIKLNLGYYPYPDYEPMNFWGDVSKLNEIIDFEKISK